MRKLVHGSAVLRPGESVRPALEILRKGRNPTFSLPDAAESVLAIDTLSRVLSEEMVRVGSVSSSALARAILGRLGCPSPDPRAIEAVAHSLERAVDAAHHHGPQPFNVRAVAAHMLREAR